MDCRLDSFAGIFIKNVSDYIIQIFRSIYVDIFHDNIYRADFAKKAIIFENDCEELFQNMCLLSNYVKTSNLLRKVIKTHCLYKEDVNMEQHHMD